MNNRNQTTLITSQAIDPMDEEISEFETTQSLNLFEDDHVLAAAKDQLERTFKKDQIPEYDDPLI